MVVATFFAVDAPVDGFQRRPSVLVELGVVEQRYQAVRDVLEGESVTDVARRNGVARQTVHTWLRRYAASWSRWSYRQDIETRELPTPDHAND